MGDRRLDRADAELNGVLRALTRTELFGDSAADGGPSGASCRDLVLVQPIEGVRRRFFVPRLLRIADGRPPRVVDVGRLVRFG